MFEEKRTNEIDELMNHLAKVRGCAVEVIDESLKNRTCRIIGFMNGMEASRAFKFLQWLLSYSPNINKKKWNKSYFDREALAGCLIVELDSSNHEYMVKRRYFSKLCVGFMFKDESGFLMPLGKDLCILKKDYFFC